MFMVRVFILIVTIQSLYDDVKWGTWAERRTLNLGIGGSIPSRPTNYVERPSRPCNTGRAEMRPEWWGELSAYCCFVQPLECGGEVEQGEENGGPAGRLPAGVLRHDPAVDHRAGLHWGEPQRSAYLHGRSDVSACRGPTTA